MAAGKGSTPAYERFVAALDWPMVVVTVADGDEWAGCAVGFHGRCSVEPPRYALWLSRANRTYRVALRSGFLGVHLLGSRDRDLGAWFAGKTGDDDDKFRGVPAAPGRGGTPMLADLPVRFVGRTVEVLDGGAGDHVCFVVEPVPDETVAAEDSDGEESPLCATDLDDIEPGHPA